MLDLAVSADDGAFAVALDLLGAHSHRRQQTTRHVDAHRIERFHHRHDVGLVPPGEWIGQYGAHCASLARHLQRWTELVEDFFHLRKYYTNFDHCARRSPTRFVSAAHQTRTPLEPQRCAVYQSACN